MNVRHGEVILAENTKNLSATLSYSSLLATTIDGDKTYIDASYSPVSVQKWNYGQLKADYSEKINIKEVENLTLNATFSDVTIDNLLHKAFIKIILVPWPSIRFPKILPIWISTFKMQNLGAYCPKQPLI